MLMGCCGTIVSLLSVGLSTNFWIALLGRALGGALNGNVGVIQTMVGEMITNPEHERKYRSKLLVAMLLLTSPSQGIRCHAFRMVCGHNHRAFHWWSVF